MNKVVLMGRLTKDPEIRYSNSDTPLAIVRYVLAIKRTHSKSSKGDADFIEVVAFGKNGEFAEKYFTKGQMVTISGRIHQDTWEDTEHVKHSKIEIIAEEQQSAGNKAIGHNQSSVDSSDHEVAATNMEVDHLTL